MSLLGGGGTNDENDLDRGNVKFERDGCRHAALLVFGEELSLVIPSRSRLSLCLCTVSNLLNDEDSELSDNDRVNPEIGGVVRSRMSTSCSEASSVSDKIVSSVGRLKFGASSSSPSFKYSGCCVWI